MVEVAEVTEVPDFKNIEATEPTEITEDLLGVADAWSAQGSVRNSVCGT